MLNKQNGNSGFEEDVNLKSNWQKPVLSKLSMSYTMNDPCDGKLNSGSETLADSTTIACSPIPLS